MCHPSAPTDSIEKSSQEPASCENHTNTGGSQVDMLSAGALTDYSMARRLGFGHGQSECSDGHLSKGTMMYYGSSQPLIERQFFSKSIDCLADLSTSALKWPVHHGLEKSDLVLL